jgi:hypothetical protein
MLAARLLEAGECLLEFDAFAQNYKMICTVRGLKAGTPAFEATLWHNRLFNPVLPSDVAILGFKPQWRSAQAHPEPP